MGTFVLEEIGIDERCHSSAQRLILIEVSCLKDLEPCFEIRIANENGRILRVAVSRAVQEPTPVWVRVFRMKACIQTPDKVPGEAIVDPRPIIFTKHETGLASGVFDDVLPVTAGAGEEQGPLGRRAHGLLLSASGGRRDPGSNRGRAGKGMAHQRAPAPLDLLRFG
ncbi:hypothetical protein HPT29_025465 (plasmid) [Microvirga terrae]|uniref:Uncharacterized protein n=1 Tax=Microvirga terrae TaxID=2740529 RepID=A0ABY5RZ13_9HYPH|nr:hypothetical protein [Microvirga terrae]UVF22503.1 hypothetical protein HPT29_025465 [Microvirga terrae]